MRNYTDFDLTPSGEESDKQMVKVLTVLFVIGVVVGMVYLYVNGCNHTPCLI